MLVEAQLTLLEKYHHLYSGAGLSGICLADWDLQQRTVFHRGKFYP